MNAVETALKPVAEKKRRVVGCAADQLIQL
jgi:hypothetical protein